MTEPRPGPQVSGQFHARDIGHKENRNGHVHGCPLGVRRRDRAAQLREAHERDLAIEKDEGVHFERAWLDPESGKVFCLSTGPSKEAVMRIHERSGHPTAEVYAIPVEVA